MSTKLESANKESPAYIDYNHRPLNRYYEIRIRRSTVFALLISILIHISVLFFYYPKKITAATALAHSLPKSISVRMVELPEKNLKPKPPSPTLLTVDKKSPLASPQTTPAIPQLPDNTAPKDFMSFIKAKKQRSQELEDFAARENAKEHGPSDDELRDANINRNLQQPGTSGIFEIKHKSIRTAQFSFKGWKNGYSIPKLELIDVTADADGDIDLAIIRKMIEIIRREYKGDFNWESQRLGRIVVLSARLGDNTGLEEFLKQEFFSADRY